MNLIQATPTYSDRHIVIFGDMRQENGFISCVYPPETVGVNPRGWRVIMFEVVIEMYPPFILRADDTRQQTEMHMYRPVKERALTAEEITHFQALMQARAYESESAA